MDRDSYHADHIPPRKTFFMGYPVISDQITSEGLAVVQQELTRVCAKYSLEILLNSGVILGQLVYLSDAYLTINNNRICGLSHVYDSFEGLPSKNVQDVNAAGVDFQAGKLYATKKEFVKQFQTARLQLPIIHKGWFDELASKDIPTQLAFAFLDGDFYASIISSLRLVWPRMIPGSVLLIDDYQRETLPGVASAVQDFFQDKHIKQLRKQADIAIINV